MYVSRYQKYNVFIETSKGGSNIQHKMLDLHKENNSLQYFFLEILPKFMLAYLFIIYSFGDLCIDGRYSQ